MLPVLSNNRYQIPKLSVIDWIVTSWRVPAYLAFFFSSQLGLFSDSFDEFLLHVLKPRPSRWFFRALFLFPGLVLLAQAVHPRSILVRVPTPRTLQLGCVSAHSRQRLA